MRIRIALLLFCLLVVLGGMQWAGNPNHWRWLTEAGKPRPVKPLQLREIEPRPEYAPPPAPGDSVQEYSSAAPGEIGPEPPTPTPIVFNPRHQLSDIQLDFWHRFIRHLDAPSRANFYRLAFAQEKTMDRPSGESVANLLQRLQAFQREYTAELLAQSGRLGSAEPTVRQAAYDLMFDWQQYWEAELTPLLEQWGTTTEGWAGAPSLQHLLNDVAVALVEDDTAIPAANDHLFLERLLARLAQTDSSAAAEAPPVTHRQLANQPDQYRGKLVSFSGRVRAAREISSRSNGNEKSFHELWVQPADGSTIPYCVLTTDWPMDAPTPTRHLQVLNRGAQFVGYFYKIRSYINSAGEVQFCPTLLTLAPEFAAAPVSKPPPPWWSIPLMIGIGILVAVLCARAAYRVSRRTNRHRMPAADPAGWRALASDPQVVAPDDRWNSLRDTRDEP